MFFADGCKHADVAREAENFDGDVDAVGPVTEVLREHFLFTVLVCEACLDRYLRHTAQASGRQLDRLSPGIARKDPRRFGPESFRLRGFPAKCPRGRWSRTTAAHLCHCR